MSSTACLFGRTAVVMLRPRNRKVGETKPTRHVTVAFPGGWSRSTLLAYCRQEHLDCTVRIEKWNPITKKGGARDADLWVCNPAAFKDYRAGVLK